MATASNSKNYYYPAKAIPNIPTIEEFKKKVTNPLLSSHFIVTFAGPYFETMNANGVLQCKVSSATMPNYQINNENTYIGGSEVSIPNGLTKGNLDLTIINQGKEWDLIYNWMIKNYNPTTRTYGYFDDIRTKIFVTQYATNGVWVLEHQYFDCSPYNMQPGQITYDSSNLVTFTLQLNFFSYMCIYNTGYENKDVGKRQGPLSYFEGVGTNVNGTNVNGTNVNGTNVNGTNVNGSNVDLISSLKTLGSNIVNGVTSLFGSNEGKK